MTLYLSGFQDRDKIMKLAVLADIHGNLVALQRVVAHIEAWQPDLVVVGGDVVNRGPQPRACLDVVLEKQQQAGWLLVRGNHEDYVIVHDRPGAPRSGPLFEVHKTAYWTYGQLGEDVSALEAMPFQQSHTMPDGSEARVVHASMLGTRNGIFPKTTDAELRQKIAPPPRLLCVGHTHWPLIRTIDHTLVVNVGSAGLPFDGDPRVSYAQLTWQAGEWQAEIIRLDYDRVQAERDFFDSGFMADSGPLAPLILDELRTAHPRLYRWTVEYEAMILAENISAEAAVERFLADL